MAVGGLLMSYQLTIEERPTHLHAKVVGERTPANALRFLEEAFAACVKSGHSSLLLEMRLSSRSITTTAVYEVILKRVPDGRRLCKIAYVDATSEHSDIPHFAETVAVNRGVNVRLFESVAVAAEWLSEGE
jgi:hypothetical protein